MIIIIRVVWEPPILPRDDDDDDDDDDDMHNLCRHISRIFSTEPKIVVMVLADYSFKQKFRVPFNYRIRGLLIARLNIMIAFI